MIKLHQLHKAISKLEMLRIHRDHMIILSPPNEVRACALYLESPNLFLLTDRPDEPTRLAGILVVEDQTCTEVVVKSLVTDHRFVVEEEARDERK